MSLLLIAASSPMAQMDLLVTFEGLCASTSSLDVIEIAAAKQGWQPFTPEADTALGKVSSFTNATITQKAFRKKTGERELQSLATQSPTRVKCIIYDFNAKQPITDQVAIGWAGGEPARRSQADNALRSLTWTATRPIKADNIVIAFASSPTMAEQLGLRGIMLSAESRIKDVK
jgi:hypothetical protein